MVSPRIAIEKRQPFGPAKSWMWSGGPLQTRPYDLDGRQTSYPYTGVGTVNLTYDLGNRIKNLSGTVTKAYGYDGPRPPRAMARAPRIQAARGMRRFQKANHGRYCDSLSYHHAHEFN